MRRYVCLREKIGAQRKRGEGIWRYVCLRKKIGAKGERGCALGTRSGCSGMGWRLGVSWRPR